MEALVPSGSPVNLFCEFDWRDTGSGIFPEPLGKDGVPRTGPFAGSAISRRIRIVHNPIGGSITAGAEGDEADGCSAACNSFGVDVPASRHGAGLCPKRARRGAGLAGDRGVGAGAAAPNAAPAGKPRLRCGNRRVVYVYSTTPPPAPAPASMSTRSRQASTSSTPRGSQRTGSLNIADALQQQVPGISVSEVAGNPFQPDIAVPRLRRIARRRHAAGTCGLPERRSHQRGVRRHRQLGPDSDRRDPVGQRRHQQSRLRPQCARRRRQRADEGRLQLSRRRNRHDGRLVRPRPGFGAMGQAGRQVLPSMARSKACTTTAFAIFRQSDVRRFYGDVGYKNDVSEFHLNMGVADNNFGATATVPVELLQTILGRDLHHAADHQQSRRLCQSDRARSRRRRPGPSKARPMCGCSTRRRWTAIRPAPSPARPMRRCFASTTTARRPMV